MKPTHENLILSYLNNEMDETQRAAFEESCRKDPALLESLKNELKVRLAVKDYAKKQRRAFYENARATEALHKKAAHVFWNPYLKIAASILIIFSISYLVYINSQAPDPANIFEDNFHPYILSSARSSPSSPVSVTDSLWQEATRAYQNKQWEQARTLLVNLLKQKDYTATDIDRLLLANIALVQDSAEVALATLDKVDNNNPALTYNLVWYRALAHVKLGDKEQALKELEKLQESRRYKESARKIMDQYRE